MKTTRPILIPALFIFASVLLFSCSEDTTPTKTADPTPTDTTVIVDTIRYTNNIKMLLDSNCNVTYCHNSGASIGSLASYNDAKSFVSNGRILGAIKHEAGFSPMPKNQPRLSDANIGRIELWISQGVNE